jgi:hypothetical protein
VDREQTIELLVMDAPEIGGPKLDLTAATPDIRMGINMECFINGS